MRLYAFSCSKQKGGWPEGGREINVHETKIVVRDKKAYRIKVRGVWSQYREIGQTVWCIKPESDVK